MRHILFILAFGLCFVSAQTTYNNTYSFNSLFNTSQTHDYKACQKINLKPGFKYVPSSSTFSTLLKVDPNLNCAVNYNTANVYNPALPLPNLVNTSDKPGKIDYNYSVDQNGSFLVNIPILSSPGTHNVQPALSLAYNSGANEGILGVGWNLNGLSSIVRGGNNYFYTGQASQISFSNNDPFYLDGQILYPLNGGNAANNTIYGTEAESYSQIKSLGNANFYYFQVKTKDGALMEYGSTADSRISVGSGTLSWLLKKVTDRNGNYWEITYKDFGENEVLPDYITYTGNVQQGLQPYNKIKFIYNQKDNIGKTFVSGFLIKSSKLLTQIIIEAENQIVRTYEMVYSQSPETKDNLLNEVVEWNELNEKYNSFKCFYNLSFPSGANATINSQVFENDNSSKYFADVNGDGFSDIISVDFLTSINSLLLKLYLNDGAGGFPSTTTITTINLPANYELAPKTWSRENNILFSDFNNDGKEDFALITRPSSNSNIYGNIIPFVSNGSSFVQHTSSSVSFPFTFDYTIGDFDGDGKVEYAFANSNNVEIKKYNTTSQSFQTTYSFAYSNQPLANIKNLSALQLTNDQKQELFFTTTNQSYYVTFNTIMTGSVINITSHGILNKTYPTSSHNCYMADFNGDGYTDIITQKSLAVSPSVNQVVPIPNDWKIAFCKGNLNHDFEFVSIGSGLHANSDMDALGIQVASSTQSVAFQNNNYSTYFITDINSDGIVEFVQSRFAMSIESNSSSSQYGKIQSITSPLLEVFSFKNTATASNPELLSQINVDINTGGHVFISPTADFDGDGHPDAYMDRFTINTYPSNVLKRFFKFPIPSRNLSMIADGFGKTVKVNYNTLNVLAKLPDPAYFTNDPYPSLAHPDILKLVPRIKVVSSLLVDVGNVSDQSISYIYQGAKFHLKGKGFLGFSSFKTKTDYEYQYTEFSDPALNPYFIRLPKYTWLAARITPSTNQTVTAQSYVNVFDNLFLYGNYQNRRYSVYTASTITTDYLNGNITSFQSNNRDSYGNITQQKTQVYLNANSLFSEEILNNTYTTDCMFDAVIPVRLSSVTQISSRIGKPNYVRTTNFNYNSTSPCLLANTLDVEKSLTANISYDSYGNIIQTSFTGNTIGSNYGVRQNIYDSKGRFLIKKTNPLGHQVQYTVEPKYGNVLAERDENNLVNSYSYDGFGRLASSTDPLGITSSMTTDWSNASPNNTLIYTKTSVPGSGSSYVYYDKLGRDIVTKNEVFNNQLRSFRTTYDNQGRVSNKIDENFNLTTSYLYDNFGRLNGLNSPNGASSQISYGVLSKTTTINQGTITQTHIEKSDASGKLIQKIDQSGTINYEYGSHGQTDKIALGNQTITMQYDNTGRQLVLNDASVGPMQFTYDELDRILTQTNAKNQVITNVYDVLGRTIQKTMPEGAIIYQYDLATNALGKLSKIINFNGQESEYQYDQFSRLSQKKEKNLLSSGDNYNFNYTYDNLGRLATETYPNNITLSYVYNSLGYLQSTKLGQTTLFSVQQLNMRDQLVQGNFGNGIGVDKNYSNFGLLTSKSYTHSNSSINTYQSYTITPSNGNLNARSVFYTTPGILNTETFNYDNSHRLTSFVPIGNPTVNMQYDAFGNMTNKTDLGQMNYASNHPNAITSVNTSTGVFPPQQQDVAYTSFQQPLSITESSYTATFSYGHDLERKVMTIQQNSQAFKQFLYLGNYEKLTIGNNTYELIYIGGYDDLAGILVSQNSGPAQMYYTQTDHLGSIIQLNDATGQLVCRVNFDAWGRERDAINLTYSNATNGKPEWLIRGFTGHEHLPEFGLINMNGRLYDPLIGRMLSPDNFVQDAASVNAFNRYSYVYNNPLKYTDPNGEYAIIDDVVAGLIGGVSNVIANWGNLNNGGGFWSTVGRGLAAFGAGAVGGIGAIYPQFGGWIWGGATVGATNAWLGGSTQTDEIISAAGFGILGSSLGGALGFAVSPLISSTVSKLISNPVVASTIIGSLSGGGVSFLTGFGVSYASTGDLNYSLRAGLTMGISGFISGAATGYISGKIQQKNQNKMPPDAPERIETRQTRLPEQSIEQYEIDTRNIEVLHSKTDPFHSLDIQSLPDKITIQRYNVKQIDGSSRYIWISEPTTNGKYNGNWEVIFESNKYQTNHTFFKKTK